MNEDVKQILTLLLSKLLPYWGIKKTIILCLWVFSGVPTRRKFR